jgi:hypothetical protein
VTERRYRAPAYNLGESHGSVLFRLIVISRTCCNDGHLGFRRLVRPQPIMTVHMDEDDDSTLDLEDFPIACPNCSSQMRLSSGTLSAATSTRSFATCAVIRWREACKPNGNVLGRHRRYGLKISGPPEELSSAVAA